MGKGRLEAFSDGVIAIIITIMVLELKVPHGTDLASLRPLLPLFLSYILSYVFMGIYWTNHHHLMQATRRVNGKILWANLMLLFWLSLVPFVTAWMGENHFQSLPMAVYGSVLLMAGVSFVFLARSIIALEGPHSQLARAFGADRKGLVSRFLYALAIPLAFVRPWIAGAIYVSVALIWFIPDPRIERTLGKEEGTRASGE